MARFLKSLNGRRPLLTVALASTLACAAFALFPTEALAAPGQFDLGLDGEGTALLAPNAASNNLSEGGAGFKIRVGDHFNLREGIRLTPEIGYSFDRLFGTGTDGAPENLNRIFAGARIGVGRFVIPTFYAHIGVGFRSISENNTVATNASLSDTGFTVDTGVAVEFRIARHLSFGPHAEYVFVDAPVTQDAVKNNGPQWLAFGGHVDFIF
jgi:hypothetical protein